MADTLSLLKRAHQGDKAARDALTEENMGLVWSVVRRFDGRKAEKEDLFQIGSIGLLKAIDKFDESYGVCFSTYAVPMIAGEIRRYLRDNSMIRVSQSLKESAVQMYRCMEKLEKTLGRDPTIQEIADEMGTDPEELSLIMEANMDVESLQQVVYRNDGNEMTLMDRLEDQHDAQEVLLDRMLLDQLLSGLTEQEKQLICMRYVQEKTQSDIAGKLGVSQVQVSRMEKRIIKKIRTQQNLEVNE